MGNVTFLPRRGGPEAVLAFDTGPGVALLDGTARRASSGREAFDRDGRRARRGRPDEALLAELLRHPFFRETPPRSTGRETFGEGYVDALLGRLSPEAEQDWDDLLATLTELSARSAAAAFSAFLPDEIDEVVLAGGGARNPALVAALERALAPLPVRTGEAALGIDPDAREAAAFALLAWAHPRGIAGNLPRVTGAAGPRVLGSCTPGPRHRGSRTTP